jgi:predicted O-methyltransferase YrrM
MFARTVKDLIQKNTLLRELLRIVRSRQVILLEFPVHSQPRWGHGQPPHPELFRLLAAQRDAYARRLRDFLALRAALARIPLHAGRDAAQPAWVNGYFPCLDATALYGLLAQGNPARYFEIGSGYSTKFARRAIRDHHLRTRITSVDPQPRAEIDALADEVVRQPLETLDLATLSTLEAGDLLFFDGSHRCLMNSDVTVFFLEILPRLRPGVKVHIHDVTLPWDYPPVYIHRYYSEQYLLAAYLLARGPHLSVLLPNAFIEQDPELSAIMTPLWQAVRLAAVSGCSFWLEIS